MLPVLTHTHDSDLSHFAIKTRKDTFCLGNVIFQLSRNSAFKAT